MTSNCDPHAVAAVASARIGLKNRPGISPCPCSVFNPDTHHLERNEFRLSRDAAADLVVGAGKIIWGDKNKKPRRHWCQEARPRPFPISGDHPARPCRDGRRRCRMHGHHATRRHLGLPLGYQPQQPMTPQFNDPRPKLWVPQPSNAVEQLSPLIGAGQPDAWGSDKSPEVWPYSDVIVAVSLAPHARDARRTLAASGNIDFRTCAHTQVSLSELQATKRGQPRMASAVQNTPLSSVVRNCRA